MMYKFEHRNLAWVVCMNVVVFMQTALAAFEPTGKLERVRVWYAEQNSVELNE